MPEAQTGSSQFVPKGMRVMAERLAAFTRNRFRIENAGSNEAKPGQTFTVTLPSNTLVDLHSLRCHATFETSGGAQLRFLNHNGNDSNGKDISVRPGRPLDYHELIQRMTVSANGTAIQQGVNEYGTVSRIKTLHEKPRPHMDTTDSTIGLTNMKPSATPAIACTSNGEDKYQSDFYAYHANPLFDQGEYKLLDHLQGNVENFFSGSTSSGVPNGYGHWLDNPSGRVGKYHDDKPKESGLGHVSDDLVLYDWRGFLKESSVRYLSTDLVGAIQIQITLASSDVLPWVGSGPSGMLRNAEYNALYDPNGEYRKQPWVANPSYQLRNIYWTIDTLSVDQAYGDMLRGKIAEFGHIAVLFKEYYIFNQASQALESSLSQRFSLSAGSMDKIYTVLRDSKYNTQPLPQVYGMGQTRYRRNSFSPNMKFICPSLESFKEGTPFYNDQANATVNGARTLLNIGTAAIIDGGRFRPEEHANSDGLMTYTYKINSVQHPQYEATARDAMFDISYGSDKIDEPRAGNQVQTRLDWFEGNAVFPCILNLTDGPLQLMSGYDSRGHSSFIEFNVKNLQADKYTYAHMDKNDEIIDVTHKITSLKPATPQHSALSITSVIETTAELRIGAGLSMAIAR